MKPSLPLAALAALLLLLLSSPSSIASSASESDEATICAAGSKQAAAESSSSSESSSSPSSCGAFFEPGAPLSAAEVAAIAASAPPAQARSEADSSPFNATVPCPTTDIIGSGIDPARVEAQLSACLNSMRTDPDRYSSAYPCSYSSWRSSAVRPKRQPLVTTGSGSNILNTAARAHSAEMASKNYFSHNSADGTSASTRITKGFGYPSSYVGENIAAGQRSVLSVCAAWMCSSGHRTNILRCGFDTLGSGVAGAIEKASASSKYGIYWTNDFGCSKSGGGCDSCGASPPQPPSPAPTPTPSPTPVPTTPPPPATTTPPATTKPPATPPPATTTPPPATTTPPATTKPPPATTTPPPATTTPPATTKPPPSPTPAPTSPPPAGSPVTKFSGSTSGGNGGGDTGTWWRPIAAGSALAGPLGRDVKYQAVRFAPAATGDYTLVVSAGPSATSAYAGEPWDNYCFVYSTASFDPKNQLVGLLRGNDDFGDDASPGRCGFSGLPLAAGKTYTLVVTSYSRAGEGSWDAEVVSGPGGFVIASQQPKSSAQASAPVVAAATAPVVAAAPPPAPAAAAVGGGGGVSSQRWDWVAAKSAASAAAQAESVSSGVEDEKAELAAMFAGDEEVERQKKEKPFEEEDH